MTPPPLPTSSNIENVRSGQKIIIYAILLNIVSFPLRLAFAGDPALNAISALMTLAAIIISIFGLLRLAKGLGYSVILRIVFGVLMILPLISLIVLLVLNAKATAFLRAAGLQVGLLGASKSRS